MRRAQRSEDTSLVLILIALVLMIAVIAAIAERAGQEPQYDPFRQVEPVNSLGFTSPLLGGESSIRINQLPQVQ